MSVNDEPGGSPNDKVDYKCYVCAVSCHTAANLQMHILGSKHKTESALRACGGLTPTTHAVIGVASQWGQTLGEQLNLGRCSEPAIGLEYVYEYRTPYGNLYYKCTLCSCQTGLSDMFMHVVGSKHRLVYLTKHNLDMPHLPSSYTERRQKLKELAAEFEAKHGRQKIQVVTDLEPLNKTSDSDFVGPNKSPRVDLASDECYMESATATSSAGPAPSFPIQALKTPAEPEKTKKNVDDFGSNEELFEYLNQFEVSCEDDAAFLLEVTQSFARSLDQYQSKSTDTQRAAVAPQDSYPTLKNSTVSSIGQHMYTEYPLENMSVPHPPVPTTSTYQAGANGSIMGTKPVSDAPISAYNSTPASFPAGPSLEGVIPALESARAMQGGSHWEKTVGPPKFGYLCHRCNKPGHHMENCPTNEDKSFWSVPRIEESTGIPRSYEVEVEEPNMKSAMLTNTTAYAIPTIDGIRSKPESGRSIELPYQTAKLAEANASDENKIEEFMSPSGLAHDPVNYLKQKVPVNPNYRCYRCGIPGHHIWDCPTNGAVNLAKANVSDDNNFEVVKCPSGLQKDPVNVPKQILPVNSRYKCYRCGIPGHHIRNCPAGAASYRSEANASQGKKIEDFLRESGLEYDPINYPKHMVPAHPRYRCSYCGITGHHISNCPIVGRTRLKKSTGIPKSFLVEVTDPSMKGAMLTSTGKYVIRNIHAAVYAMESTGKPEDPSSADKPIPDK